MRINSISSFNYNQRKSLNFGKFMDENARKVVREATTVKDPNEAYMQPVYDSWYNRIDKCDYIEVYTDTDDVVKGRFSDEFMKNNSNDNYLMLVVDTHKEDGDFNNYSLFKNVQGTFSCIKIIDKVLAGINPADEHRSDNNIRPYGQYNSYAEMRIPGNDPWDIT